jgi:hypothetical protein
MDNVTLREALLTMVQQIPDGELEEARRMLQALVESRDKRSLGGTLLPEEDGETLIEPLEDENMLRPEFVAELKESEEAARRGDVVTLEEFLRGAAR